MADAITFGEQQLATGQFPRLAALYQQQQAMAEHGAPDEVGPPMTPDLLGIQFEHGLSALLDGSWGRSESAAHAAP